MAGRKAHACSTNGVLRVALALVIVSVAFASAEDRPRPRFVTSDRCIACHSNMVDAAGETLSIGHTWRASMMALAAKDPYWQAAVRREIADHPHLEAAIEDTCSICHMPMFRTQAVADGRSGEILRYLQGGFAPQEQGVAADGVSCTVCHQISAENLGQHASFDGGYLIEPALPEEGMIYGPYEVDPGLQRLMHSASGQRPAQATHIQRSELCATCHTLFTAARDGQGEIIGDFAEQVPFLEWKHSAYHGTDSCQDCHMPEVGQPVPITSVLGEPRQAVSRHAFRGGNVFMLRMLDRYRDELGVTTPVADLERSADGTLEHLQTRAAEVDVTGVSYSGSEILIDLRVTNLAGHKLPTAYPSRRAWLHVVVRDKSGRTVFESGRPEPGGSIAGNDNDANAAVFEPHYLEIRNAGQVQIYEPILHDYKHDVTTSLLAGVTYVKDNRLLPRGFDKTTAQDHVSVEGAASGDADFEGGGDQIRYRVSVPGNADSLQVVAELLYQTIGYRWAQNLAAFDSLETHRFVGFYRQSSPGSAVVLARAQTQVPLREGKSR